MGKKFIVSAFGKDRPGIVADVTQVLYENDCNLEDTRMANLSGEFSLLILFAGPADIDVPATLAQPLSRLESEKGISTYLRTVGDAIDKKNASQATHKLKVEGLDHTGIVYGVSRFLAEHQINIANLDSSIARAPESGAPVYSMAIEMEVPQGTSLADIETGLGRLADQLHVEIAID